MHTGSQGTKECQQAFWKHKLVIQSLTLVKAHLKEPVQFLDKPIATNGNTYTLRDVILSIPFRS